jgi:hypothetical protein
MLMGKLCLGAGGLAGISFDGICHKLVKKGPSSDGPCNLKMASSFISKKPLS